MPAGLAMTTGSQPSIFGNPTTAGEARFSLVLTDDQNRVSYQQFLMQVDLQKVSVSCPAGYYYDSTSLYCVESQSTCAEGTYFEPSANSCVAYPSPPPAVFCQGDQYFDPYLSVCVEKGFPRCPLNFHWDRIRNHCIHNQLECPPGFAPNFAANTCYAIWTQTCDERSHWDNYSKRCLVNIQHCDSGSFWDVGQNRCQVSHGPASCNEGSHWDPALQICQRNEARCDIGFVRQGDRCIPLGPPSHNCSSDQHWDGGHCSGNIKPEPQPKPEPRPHPRPHIEKLPTDTP